MSSWVVLGRRFVWWKKSGIGCCSSVWNRKLCVYRFLMMLYNLRFSCVRFRRFNGCRWFN